MLFRRALLILFLFCLSPYAHAANMVPWKTYLFVVLGIALIAGSILSARNKKAEGRVAKIVMAGVYFWLSTFAELTVLAVI